MDSVQCHAAEIGEHARNKFLQSKSASVTSVVYKVT